MMLKFYKSILGPNKFSRIYILPFLFMYFCFVVQMNGQRGIRHNENADNFWHAYCQELDNKLELQHVATTKFNFYFRYYNAGQVIDIWQDQDTFKGFVTNWTHLLPKTDTVPENQYEVIFRHLNIDTAIARKGYSFIKIINQIPTQDSIKKWSRGFDGSTYIFETTTDNKYTFKNYWSPLGQDSSVSEIRSIQNFIRNMDTFLHLRTVYDSFFSTLKGGSYYSTNGGVATYKFSNEQMANYRKYKTYYDYHDSIKETLDQYLSDTLTKLFQIQKYEFDNTLYNLVFSKKNKLIKVIRIKDSPKYYGSNSPKIMLVDKNKLAIKRAFKKVDINFVHSQYNYLKVFRYYNQQVIISQ